MKPIQSLSVPVGLALAALLCPSFLVREARACGCFAPPVPRPEVQGNFAVNQRAEQIIFEVSPGMVSAHVRILYEGDPAEFAWLLPMPGVPEIELSETDLFAYVAQQTSPSLNVQNVNLCPEQRYYCRTHPPCPVASPNNPNSAVPYGYAAEPGVMYGAPMSAADGTAAPTAPPVTVLASARVGAYDTITFAAEDAALAIQWLNDNGFIVNETMSPYMQPYLDSGLVFVASKLVPGTDLDEIRPLRLTYEASMPSIPLRLTAIAAEPHMTVTAFIYASEEFDPVVARLVEVPAAELADGNGRRNYPMLMARVVDEMGGFAFVKEYVGPGPRLVDQTGCCTVPVTPASGVAPSMSETSSQVSSSVESGSSADAGSGTDVGSGPDAGSADAGSSPDAASTATGAAGSSAIAPTPPVRDPADVCLVGGDGLCQCPLSPFDAVDCSEGLIAGIGKANELSLTYPVLTRLTTRISPEEMVEDPLFEPSLSPGGPTRLALLGQSPSLLGCEGQVEDAELYQEIIENQACSAVYCDWGECVITEYGAGCRCDEGFVGRLFTDGDGAASVTCVPETPPVDFAAGGLDLPSPCDAADDADGECVDLGGFAGLRCASDEAAVIELPIIAAPTLTCSSVARGTSSKGATNYSSALNDIDVCALPPPACSTNGWLEERVVTIPGKDCGDGPDASWFVPPPAPVCPPLDGSTSSAQAPAPAPAPVVVTDTHEPRPDATAVGEGIALDEGGSSTTPAMEPNPASSNSGDCSLISQRQVSVPWWTSLALALVVGLRRRRR